MDTCCWKVCPVWKDFSYQDACFVDWCAIQPHSVYARLVACRRNRYNGLQPEGWNVPSKKRSVFANFVLADEINRAPAKVQSALLEKAGNVKLLSAMKLSGLPKPFLVLATQNPIEQEGTYPLPEAQVDRFMLKVVIDYPKQEGETDYSPEYQWRSSTWSQSWRLTRLSKPARWSPGISGWENRKIYCRYCICYSLSGKIRFEELKDMIGFGGSPILHQLISLPVATRSSSVAVMSFRRMCAGATYFATVSAWLTRRKPAIWHLMKSSARYWTRLKCPNA